MSKPDVGVRWLCQAQMSASRWGPWGRAPAMGRVVDGREHAVNLGERLFGARGRDGLRWGAHGVGQRVRFRVLDDGGGGPSLTSSLCVSASRTRSRRAQGVPAAIPSGGRPCLGLKPVRYAVWVDLVDGRFDGGHAVRRARVRAEEFGRSLFPDASCKISMTPISARGSYPASDTHGRPANRTGARLRGRTSC